MKNTINHKKYRWFYTSSEKIVVGGKNSLQNDELITQLKSFNSERVVMHTSTPGSPFSIILSDNKEVNNKDIEECAVFTACFSQVWKSQSKSAKIHIFRLSQLNKTTKMKSGTWGVTGKVKEISVPLKLVLTKQGGVLRAVPEKSVKNKKDVLLTIIPGKIDKLKMVSELSLTLENNFTNDEILSAIPAGGLKMVK